MTVRRYILEPLPTAALGRSRQDYADPAIVAAYLADLRAGRPLPPIVVTEDGREILDGFHRHMAAVRHGLAEMWAFRAEGADVDSVWVPSWHPEVWHTRGDRR
jgi:hypothetical protein